MAVICMLNCHISCYRAVVSHLFHPVKAKEGFLCLHEFNFFFGVHPCIIFALDGLNGLI